MDIHEALAKLDLIKQTWFKYKFPELQFDGKQRSLDTVLRSTNRKTIYGFKKWERTEEYKNLVALYLAGKTAEDLIQMYNAVKDKALKGDEKAVKLMLQLQKEIDQHKKQAIKSFNQLDEEEIEDDDDLEL